MDLEELKLQGKLERKEYPNAIYEGEIKDSKRCGKGIMHML